MVDRYKQKLKVNKAMEPYLLPEGDPDYIKRRPVEPKPLPAALKRKSKPNKVLTNLKRFATLPSVNIIKSRKGDKMNKDNKKTSNKSGKGGMLKSAGWLVLATQQGFVGYVLLTNFSNYFVVAAAIASLLIAGVIVVAHFVGAHK